MPFQSEKQRRYLHANHPDIAQRWEQEYGGGGIARLHQAYPNNMTVGEDWSEYTDDPEYDDDPYGFDRMNEEKYGDVYNQGMKFGDAENLQEYFASNPQLYEGMIDKTMDTAGGIWDYARQKGLGLQHGLGLVNENYLMPAVAGVLGLANRYNPLSEGSQNYNRELQGQIDYLKEVGGLSDPSNPYRITGGPLAGQNLVSGFGTNDYGRMLDKRINYFRKQQAKKGELTKEQHRRMDEAIREKERADAAAAAAKKTQQHQAQQRQMEQDRQGGQNRSSQTFRSAPGGLSQAQSRAARGDPQGTGGGWKW